MIKSYDLKFLIIQLLYYGSQSEFNFEWPWPCDLDLPLAVTYIKNLGLHFYVILLLFYAPTLDEFNLVGWELLDLCCLFYFCACPVKTTLIAIRCTCGTPYHVIIKDLSNTCFIVSLPKPKFEYQYFLFEENEFYNILNFFHVICGIILNIKFLKIDSSFVYEAFVLF